MASYAYTQTSPTVDRVPFFASGALTDGSTATVTFDNVTDQIVVSCTSAGAGGTMKIGVTTTGVASTQNLTLASGGTTGTIDVRLKQVVIKAVDEDITYQVFAVLSRDDSSTYPDITTANGFAGV